MSPLDLISQPSSLNVLEFPQDLGELIITPSHLVKMKISVCRSLAQSRESISGDASSVINAFKFIIL